MRRNQYWEKAITIVTYSSELVTTMEYDNLKSSASSLISLNSHQLRILAFQLDLIVLQVYFC